MIGLTNFTTKAHICRATLEAVCFQSREVQYNDYMYENLTTSHSSNGTCGKWSSMEHINAGALIAEMESETDSGPR